MQKNLSEQTRDCYRHAENCARQAAAEIDAKMKKEFLVMERRWRSLVAQHLTDFSDEKERDFLK